MSLDLDILPDHTTQAKLALARARARQHDPKIYNGVDDGRLIIDWRHVRLAAQRLGVCWPITIGWMSINDEPDSYGLYIATPDQAHTIRLRNGLSATDTARVLRHELAHCKQREATAFNDFEARRDTLEQQANALGSTLRRSTSIKATPVS